MAGFQEQLQRDAAACDAVLQQLIAKTKGPANRLLEALERNYWQPDDETLAALQASADELEDRLEGLDVAAE